MIISDYYPLYEFQSGKCFSSEEEKNDSNLTVNKKSNVESHRGLSTSELILVVWVFTLFCESIREVKRSIFVFFHRISILLDRCDEN
jgi:hypothetical protein